MVKELEHLAKRKSGPFQAKIQIIQVSNWGDSIHIKFACYWCNWLLSVLDNLSNNDDFSESEQLARKMS